ncbi:MAG: hypothetical protein V1754_04660, partial [Pseudomonadota bacterium]
MGTELIPNRFDSARLVLLRCSLRCVLAAQKGWLARSSLAPCITDTILFKTIWYDLYLAFLIAFVFGTVSSALAMPSDSSSILVEKDGRVFCNSTFVGQIPLPPRQHKTTKATTTVAGHKLLYVLIQGSDERRTELLATYPPNPRIIFVGTTGPQGIDGEWNQHLEVTRNQILLYQTRPDIARCDEVTPYLFPKVYDFESRKFRPVSRINRPKNIPTLRATQTPSILPNSPPLNTFRLVSASTQMGDLGQAINLVAPIDAQDGKIETSWSEELGGDGQGEFLLARSRPSPYRLKALSIIPGDASSNRAFSRANRLKSILLAFSPKQKYRITFARDPKQGKLNSPFWAILPKPVATNCAILVIEEVYPGLDVRKNENAGRTAIAEIQFFTELEFGKGLSQVLEDLGSTDDQRSKPAIAVLVGLGEQGAKEAILRLPHSKGLQQPRLVQILSISPIPEAAPALTSVLHELDHRT